jgi:hypothetical protein
MTGDGRQARLLHASERTGALEPAPGVSLETNPVEYMAVALDRAKDWLAEAQSIEDVRETKAIAVGYESVIREKELALDAQLSATEIVRRCERRIGELVRKGQENREFTKQGQTRKSVHLRGDEEPSTPVGTVYDNDQQRTDSYVLADAPDEQFEDALSEARDEGNLSRANVVRKVKGGKPKPAERSEWHRKRRRIDSNRILRTLAEQLDAATAGLDLMDPQDLDRDLASECVESIDRSIRTIRTHLRRLK